MRQVRCWRPRCSPMGVSSRSRLSENRNCLEGGFGLQHRKKLGSKAYSTKDAHSLINYRPCERVEEAVLGAPHHPTSLRWQSLEGNAATGSDHHASGCITEARVRREWLTHCEHISSSKGPTAGHCEGGTGVCSNGSHLTSGRTESNTPPAANSPEASEGGEERASSRTK